MSGRFPVSLKISIPLLLLGFAATLSIVNVLYNLPQAERAAEEDARKHAVQELSRLQSTIEYLLLKGDLAAVQHQVSVAAHNHDIALLVVGDDRQAIVAATRRAWLGVPMQEVLPQFDPEAATQAVRERRARVVDDAAHESLLGYAGVMMGRERDELRPSKAGSLFLSFDLTRSRTEARALVVRQSVYWAGSVIVLALVLWLAFHFLLTRRTARLVRAAERFAAGDLSARSDLSGGDELGKLSQVFDAMATDVACDIAEKKRAAEQLATQREAIYRREKLAALGSLLAGVAHELNNPLSVVVARAVMLEEGGGVVSPDAAVKIRSAAERCARIVRTYLAMARQQQPERGMVAIDDVIAAALDITGYSMRASGIEVKLDLDPDIPRILADGDQLHQVVLNLIINAQQSLQERTPPRRIGIMSRFDPPAAMLRVVVSDNGPGVPRELRARVFEPYFTTKSIGVGTGVGLAVSLGIVEAHGGTLTLDCPDRGGAEFTVALPVGEAGAAVEPAEATPQSVAGPARSVLIVDDEAEVRDTLADILRGPDRSIVTVSSGRQALVCLESRRYDVILTDIRMPDLDGPSLYREIVRRWPLLAERVVFVTGDTLGSSLDGFASHSGQPVIEKPFLPGEVRRVVDEVACGAERPIA